MNPSPLHTSFKAEQPVRPPPEPADSARRRRPRRSRRRPRRFIPAALGLIDRLLPPSYLVAPDADMHRRGRLLVAASLGFFVIALFFGTQMSLVDQYPLASILIMYSGCVFTVANLFLLRRTRSTTLPGALLCLESLAIFAFQAYNDLGLDDPVLIWTLVIPWLAAFLVGPGAGFVFAGLVVLVMSGFYMLELGGHPFPDFTGAEEYWLFYFLEVTTLALFLGFLGWLYEGQTLRNLREANLNLGAMHKDLQKSKQRIEQILESMTDGFFALDNEGRFTDLNRQAEHFLNERRSELLGLYAWEYFSPHVGSDIQGKLYLAAETGIPVEFETFFPPLRRWFEVHIHPFEDRVSVYFSDITERKDYEKGLIVAKEEAEHLAYLKSNLLANMSHEIRTPLTSVIGFASILQEEAAGEHQHFAQLIGENGRRLMETLNSVLDLAKLERGVVECNLEVLDIGIEVTEIVELLRPLAHERNLKLFTDIEGPHLEAPIDKAMLSRVLNNLVGNAIKFTPEGHIKVSVFAIGPRIGIRVRDTGIGISQSFLPHLFEEFRQESMGLSRAYEGNGLGLAITRRLVDSMNGTIEVESEKDVGTTFTVWLARATEKDFFPASTPTQNPSEQTISE